VSKSSRFDPTRARPKDRIKNLSQMIRNRNRKAIEQRNVGKAQTDAILRFIYNVISIKSSPCGESGLDTIIIDKQ
jgi:hypothetical protein